MTETAEKFAYMKRVMSEAEPLTSSEGAVCAVVVTYNPDKAILEVLVSCLRQVGHVVVVDNSSSVDSRSMVSGFAETSCLVSNRPASALTYFANTENLGLSKAFNIGACEGAHLGYKFFLFLDQDSILQGGAVSALLSAHDKMAPVACIGALNCHNEEPRTTPLDIASKKFYRWKYERGSLYSGDAIHERRTVINSGLLMPAEVFSEIGGYSEKLFVDAIDLDMSYNLRTHGYKLFQVDTARITHNQGISTFGAGPLEIRSHSLGRQYYMVRDTLCAFRKWWRKFPASCCSNLIATLFGTMMRILFLPGRSERLRVVVQGLFDQPYTF
jgi:rhamnosyltransferase